MSFILTTPHALKITMALLSNIMLGLVRNVRLDLLIMNIKLGVLTIDMKLGSQTNIKLGLLGKGSFRINQ